MAATTDICLRKHFLTFGKSGSSDYPELWNRQRPGSSVGIRTSRGWPPGSPMMPTPTDSESATPTGNHDCRFSDCWIPHVWSPRPTGSEIIAEKQTTTSTR